MKNMANLSVRTTKEPPWISKSRLQLPGAGNDGVTAQFTSSDRVARAAPDELGSVRFTKAEKEVGAEPPLNKDLCSKNKMIPSISDISRFTGQEQVDQTPHHPPVLHLHLPVKLHLQYQQSSLKSADRQGRERLSLVYRWVISLCGGKPEMNHC